MPPRTPAWPATADPTGSTGRSPSIAAKVLSFVSGGTFEGEISMAITPEGKPPHFVVYEMKDPKVRFDFGDTSGEATYVVVDYAAKKTAVVDDKKKLVTLVSTEEAVAIDDALSKKKVAVAATGKTDVVAGYSCEVYQRLLKKSLSSPIVVRTVESTRS